MEYFGEARMAAITLLTGSWLWIHLSANEIYTGASMFIGYSKIQKTKLLYSSHVTIRVPFGSKQN